MSKRKWKQNRCYYPHSDIFFSIFYKSRPGRQAGSGPKGFDDVTRLLALGPLRFLLFMRGNGSTAFGKLGKACGLYYVCACVCVCPLNFEL